MKVIWGVARLKESYLVETRGEKGVPVFAGPDISLNRPSFKSGYQMRLSSILQHRYSAPLRSSDSTHWPNFGRLWLSTLVYARALRTRDLAYFTIEANIRRYKQRKSHHFHKFFLTFLHHTHKNYSQYSFNYAFRHQLHRRWRSDRIQG